MPPSVVRSSSARIAAAVALLGLNLTAWTAIAPVAAAPSPQEVRAAEERLLELEREFQLVSEEYNRVHEELTAIQARIGASELEARDIERRMADREDTAIDLAQELYKNGPTGTLEAVLSSRSITELEARLTYLQSSEQAHAEVFERLAVDRAALQQTLAVLEDERADAAAAEARLTDLRQDIENRVASQNDEVADLNAALERARARAEARADAARAPAANVTASLNPAPAPAPNAGAGAAVDAALSQVGKPYQWGAAGPSSYDCSGLTMWAWAHAGVALPHNSGMQYNATPRVARSDWEPGDLLFFGSPIHHVAMYIGNGQMVEAPYSGQQVRVVSASRSDNVGAGRPGA